MTDKTIVIGGQTVEIKPIPLGRLKKLVPAFKRIGAALASGSVEEWVMSDCIEIIAAATNTSVEQVEAMPMRFDELSSILEAVAEVAGLQPAGGAQPGEALPSSTTTSGTESTEASSPAQAGPGDT